MNYKALTHSINSGLNTECVVTSNNGAYLSMPINAQNLSVKDGMYILCEKNCDKVIIPNIVDSIDINGNCYELLTYNTSSEKANNIEYLKETDVLASVRIVYELSEVTIEKMLFFHPDYPILCVKYCISNKSKKNITLSAKPLITYRKTNESKRESTMKYIFSKLSDGSCGKISLSITDDKNLYMKPQGMKFKQKEGFVRGIQLNHEMEDGKQKTAIEDLYYPGSFEINVKSGNTSTACIFFSVYDIQDTKLDDKAIETTLLNILSDRLKDIDSKFHELRSLAKTAYNFYHIDQTNKRLIVTDAYPRNNGGNAMSNIMASIEGNYLILKRYKEAYKILETLKNKLEQEKGNYSSKDECEAFLLFVEAINRYYHSSDCRNSEIKEMYLYIKQEMYAYIASKNENIRMNEKYILQVDDKQYIKINALWYNALKVLIEFMDNFHDDSSNIYEIAKTLRLNVLKDFFDENKKTLKYELNEKETYANIDMLYTMSLSYPMVSEEIGIKIIDTCFKELYTPLGMRKFSTSSPNYDGYVYPSFMVHFLKANLRQMGVTRATQKIGYNLVKELLQEINKRVEGSVSPRYNDKTGIPDGETLSSLTNAECIRMYSMLM